MEEGPPVWVRDPENAWVPGSLVRIVKQTESTDKAPARCTLQLRLEQGNEITLESLYEPGSQSELTDVKLANLFDGGAESAAKVDDLVSLTLLHEPSILDVLCRRYQHDKIYTYCGTILLALNPFQSLPVLYSNEMLANYYSVGLLRGASGEDAPSSKLPPHVYRIADNAYRSMVTAMAARLTGEAGQAELRNQSMLISGESGAGKTETTKIAMSYLATVGRSATAAPTTAVAASSASKSKEGEDDEDAGDAPVSVEARVLDSNPILEAFGNAKTLRNENSSRFGKFIELQFDRRGHLVGARIQTYLLEKVRLVHQGKGERNYHSFYQVMAGAKDKERKLFGLTGMGPESFVYTASSGCYELKGVDDGANYAATTKAMRTLGLKKDARRGVFGILAGVLHLGNVAFEAGPGSDGGERSSVTAATSASLAEAARLLGLEPKSLTSILTQQKLDVRGDITYRTFPPNIAGETRDALAKQVYGRLFDWLVMKVNASIRADDQTRSFIGVLDIFGFESFETNSFEQLCINFANETLQQHFNSYVFKLEQAEYAREAIAWSSIDFADNEDVLAMIAAKKPAGLLPLLDETCLMPKGDDSTYARKVYEQLKAHARFEATARHKAREQFIVRHYAGDVVYTALGFCDKNRDTIHTEALEVMAGSANAIVAACFVPGFGAGKDEDVPAYARDDAVANPASPGPAPAASSNSMAAAAAANAKLKATVGTQFTNQLRSLMAIIRGTKSHYIRCLKPNSQCVPGRTERVSLVGQLRCGGVLEAVRVSRLGYPVRLHHSAAIARYRAVAAARLARIKRAAAAAGAGSKGAAAVASASIPLTFVDLTDHRLAHAEPGKMKAACADALRVLGAARDQYQVGLTKVFFRKGSYEAVERARAEEMREAALLISRRAKGHVARKAYLKCLASILRLQCRVRSWIARRKVAAIRRQRAAVRLQTRTRAFLCRSRFVSFRHAVLRCQALWRGVRDRRLATSLRRDRAAVAIQSAYRGSVCRRAYTRRKAACVVVQCAVRVWLSRRALARLRREARDVASLKDEYKRMKDGWADMEAQLGQAREEVHKAGAEVQELRDALAASRLEASTARQEAAAASSSAQAALAEATVLREELGRVQARLAEVEEELTKTREATALSQAEAQASSQAKREAEEQLARERETAAVQRQRLQEEAGKAAEAASSAAQAEALAMAQANLQHALAGVEADLAACRRDLAEARQGRNDARAELARDRADAATREAHATSSLAELQAQLGKEKARAESAVALVQSTRDEAAGLTAEVEAGKSLAQQAQAQAEEVKTRLQAVEAELVAARQAVHDGQAEVSRLSTALELQADKAKSIQGEAARKLASTEAALARALNEATSTGKALVDTKAALATVEERLREADREAKDRAARIAGLEKQLAQAHAQAQAQAQALVQVKARADKDGPVEGAGHTMAGASMSSPAVTPALHAHDAPVAPAPAPAPVTVTSTSGAQLAQLTAILETAAEEDEEEDKEAGSGEAKDAGQAPLAPVSQVPMAPSPVVAPTAAPIATPGPVTPARPPPLPTPASAPGSASSIGPLATTPAGRAVVSPVPGQPALTPQAGKPGTPLNAGAQAGWLFTRSGQKEDRPGGQAVASPSGPAAGGGSITSPSTTPAPGPAKRRTSMLGFLGSSQGPQPGPASGGKGKAPAVGEKERRAAELAAILVANGDLKATAGPSIVLPEGVTMASPPGSGARDRRPSSASAIRRQSSLGPMSSLSSSGMNEPVTVTVGGQTVDVASLAKRTASGADPSAGMISEVLREMGSKMVGLKAQAEAATREARQAGQARDELTLRMQWLEHALATAQADAAKSSAQAKRSAREADDALSKMGALEAMAEMASGVKLALAQRLEAALGEAADLADALDEARKELARLKAGQGQGQGAEGGRGPAVGASAALHQAQDSASADSSSEAPVGTSQAEGLSAVTGQDSHTPQPAGQDLSPPAEGALTTHDSGSASTGASATSPAAPAAPAAPVARRSPQPTAPASQGHGAQAAPHEDPFAF